MTGIICMEKQKSLSQAKLKGLLTYEPLTGVFTWRETRGSVSKGGVAGTVGTSTGGYVNIRVDGIRYQAHRLAFLYMEGYFPESRVDHRDQRPANNAWDNLREVSHSCNMKNSKTQCNNTSGVVGVSRHGDGRLASTVRDQSEKVVHLGLFDTLIEAALARWEAEVYYQYPDCNSHSTARAYILKHNPYLLEFDFEIKARWLRNGGRFKLSATAVSFLR